MLSMIAVTVDFFRGSDDEVGSLSLNEDAVVVRGHSPVFAVVVLVGEVLLVVGEERVELEALLEVLGGLEAADVLEHVEVALGVGAGLNETVPVHTLKAHVGVVLLEAEVHGGVEANVRTLDGMHVIATHLKLGVIEVLREHFHLLLFFIIYYNTKSKSH